MENQLKNKKVNLIGPNHGLNGCDWKIVFTKLLNELGAEVSTHYTKPYIYTPRERPETHEVLKDFKNSGYHQETCKLPHVSILDKSWIAEHMKAVRREETEITKDCDLVFCYIDPDVFAAGAMEQLCHAFLFKKPIFLMVEGGFSGMPIWLLGMAPHDYVYSSFGQFKKAINRIGSGKISIKEDDYWGLYNKAYDE
jgi:hypothetical protein